MYTLEEIMKKMKIESWDELEELKEYHYKYIYL